MRASLPDITELGGLLHDDIYIYSHNMSIFIAWWKIRPNACLQMYTKQVVFKHLKTHLRVVRRQQGLFAESQP